MIPSIRNTPTYTLDIPELSGGMNLRDGLTLINDNQLTDVKNMWFKDGMLKTRPKLHTDSDISKLYTNISKGESYRALQITTRSYPECTMISFDKTYTLQVIATSKIYGTDDIENEFTLRYVSENLDVINLGKISIISKQHINHCLVFQHNGDIYLFTADDKPHYWVIKRDTKNIDAYLSPKELLEEDMTAPLVATNGLPSIETGFKGTTIDGYNLLTRYYKAEYSTVDKDKESNEMRYPLYHPVRKAHDVAWEYAVDKKVTATYTDIKGNKYTHEVIIDKYGEGYEEHPNEGDNLTMWVLYQEVFFWDKKTKNYAILTKDEYVANNLTITAPGPYDEANELKVVNMTKSAWFGGSAKGLYGGSRLFLCGNTEDKEKALVVWSDLNDPLYFSENNYAYVGDKTQRVTAFGKQADTLVIFKERETYQTQYVANNSYTAEDVINQNVIDLSAQSVIFPMTLVHGHIGCDCPDTVALCRNRLVWTCLNGKVYTLQSQNQYNERAIFEVGEMIESRLKTEQFLNLASAVDYDGHYILQNGNRMYVMDYNSYGYIYVSSHAKNEDANIKIPWYYWELPIEVEDIRSGYDRLIMTYKSGTEPDENLKSETAVNLAYIDSSIGDDEINNFKYDDGWKKELTTIKIPSYLQTKLYNFGSPARLKSVPIVSFSFGYNGGEPINIRFISERNTPDEHTVTLDGAETNEREPEHIHQCRLFPYTKGTVMFGARLTCEGNMSIASMTLQYKALGGAK